MASTSSSKFLCGVVEGFYSKPWSADQRLCLMDKMAEFRLNAYLYAPKDDVKHRAKWRQPYTHPELAQLQQLIDKSKSAQCIFFYGISPGLDMVYSDPEELNRLKNKCLQLKQLGCEAFALLWDDIGHELRPTDRSMFNSLADAHVSISNQLFQALEQPAHFLICPIEYSSNMARPDVSSSPYLNTLGMSLHPQIGVFWTGDKCVSESISKEHILQVTAVLHRKPTLWDNLHANDYDQQRLFLGPYSGRSPDIIPHIAGVLTNPNCEYSVNVCALYTLGAWAACYDPRTQAFQPWHPVIASELAISPFIDEMNRPLSTGPSTSPPQEEPPCFEKEEITLLFHFFWLPYANGPLAAQVLDHFQFCRDFAHVVSRTDLEPGTSNELLDKWTAKANVIRDLYKRYNQLLDKMIHMPNRVMFFELSSYLSNVQTMLLACVQYLNWVALDRCKKPLIGGPTLAGLPGGFAGDLQRLYPVTDKSQFPLINPVSVLDKVTVLRPLNRKERPQLLTFVSHISATQFFPVFVETFTAKPDPAIWGWDWVIEHDDSIMAFASARKCTDECSKMIQTCLCEQDSFTGEWLVSSVSACLVVKADGRLMQTKLFTELIRVAMTPFLSDGSDFVVMLEKCPTSSKFFQNLGYKAVLESSSVIMFQNSLETLTE